MFIIHQDEKTVTIATESRSNRKTGHGVQLWILDATMHPVESRKSGHDAENQCMGCPLASNNGCYVAPMPLMAIWKAWKNNRYKVLEFGSEAWNVFFDDSHFVRFGAYGNPSLIPLAMVADIASRASVVTGYFHDWNLMPVEKAKAYGQYFMASCEPSNWKHAQALGLRTFTTCTDESEVIGAGIECVADATNNRIQCRECGLCDGNRRNKNLKSVWIKVHGFQLKKATAAVTA